MKKKLIFSLFVVLTSPLVANSTDSIKKPEQTKLVEYPQCLKVDNLNSLKDCLKSVSEKYNKQVNQEFNKLNNILTTADKSFTDKNLSETFKNSQFAWEEYKKRSCEFYATQEIGSQEAGIAYNACEVRMLQERLNEINSLKEFYTEQYEGPVLDALENNGLVNKDYQA